MSASDYDFLFKLLIIGDSGVGKSSLLLRYTDDSFSPQYITTIGVDFKIKTITIDDIKLKLQIWDTAGQERFRTITSTYYRGAHGIIVVYDVNQSRTFENVQCWFKEISDNCPDSVAKIIVGNKNDTPELKAVPTSELKTMAEQYDVDCIETSAKENDNVEQMFNLIAAKILKVKLFEKQQQQQQQPQQQQQQQQHNQGRAVKLTKLQARSSSKKRFC